MTGQKRVCTVEDCGQTTVARRLCRKHYQQAWKSGMLGAHEKQPPRPRKRTICPPSHKHGASSTCYIQHQCRCAACCDAHNARDRQRKKLKAYGRYDSGLVDAGPVREHLLALAEYGIGYKRVATLSGLHTTPVRNLIWGRQDPGPRHGELQQRVKRETAEKILAVRAIPENLAGGARVSARGAQRRLQALVARGWSMSKLAARLGMLPTNMSNFMSQTSITSGRFQEICRLYDELWDQEPPAETTHDRAAITRAKRSAKAHRWAPPLAWDDIDHDAAPQRGRQPEAQEAEDAPTDDHIDEIAVELAIRGQRVPLSKSERRTAIQRLHALRHSDPQISKILHCAERTVLRDREELGLGAWTIAEQQHARAAA